MPSVESALEARARKFCCRSITTLYCKTINFSGTRIEKTRKELFEPCEEIEKPLVPGLPRQRRRIVKVRKMANCVSCHDPLVIEIELEDDDEDVEMGESSNAAGPSTSGKQTVPDDVHLNCGCHFHWYVTVRSVDG
jgi:hypothetical protein